MVCEWLGWTAPHGLMSGPAVDPAPRGPAARPMFQPTGLAPGSVSEGCRSTARDGCAPTDAACWRRSIPRSNALSMGPLDSVRSVPRCIPPRKCNPSPPVSDLRTFRGLTQLIPDQVDRTR